MTFFRATVFLDCSMSVAKKPSIPVIFVTKHIDAADAG